MGKRKLEKEQEKMEQARNKIDNFFQKNDIIISYLLQIDDIIIKNWDHLEKGLTFKNVEKKKQRYAIYLLAEYYNLSIAQCHVIKISKYINRKFVDNPPEGFELIYHSLTCQDCPEIIHNGKDCCQCTKCQKISDKMTFELKFVDITINIQKNSQMPNQTLAEKYHHKVYKRNPTAFVSSQIAKFEINLPIIELGIPPIAPFPY